MAAAGKRVGEEGRRSGEDGGRGGMGKREWESGWEWTEKDWKEGGGVELKCVEIEGEIKTGQKNTSFSLSLTLTCSRH